VWAPLLVSPGDVARNIALYVPFGMLGLLALGRPGPRGVARVTALALLFSAVIETAQLYTTDRVASLTDIASAGAGTAIGASLIVALVAGAR
jgi:VanZ family protein